MLPVHLTQSIEALLSKYVGTALRIKNTRSVGGGCINNTLAVHTKQGDFFVKSNNAQRFPRMFEAEATGLQLLAAADAIDVPAVIGCGESQGESFIVLEFIQASTRSKLFWENFGRALAMLHLNTAAHFGLKDDNYIGSLPQYNKQSEDWISFFVHQRLEKQVRLALEKGLFTCADALQFEQLYLRLPNLLPVEAPALLHGDLWSGNFLTGADGEAVLIDPAVYYGHREAELAFTQLFGGFDARFYIAYHAAYPLHPGFEDRTVIYNLYPLLVHVNLFGGSYVQSVKSILKNIL